MSLSRFADWLVSVAAWARLYLSPAKGNSETSVSQDKAFDERFPELLEQCRAAFESGDSLQADAAIAEVFAALADQVEEPTKEDVLSAIACQCEENADWVGAEAAYKQKLALPDRGPVHEVTAHSALIKLYSRVLNRRSEALEHLHQATEAARRAGIDILLVNALQSEAAFLIDENKIVEARQIIDEALSYIKGESLFNQLHASTLIIRATCKRLSGQLIEAEQDLGQAYELLAPLASIELAAGIQSDFADMWAGTARLREEQSDHDGAIAAWQEAVRLKKHVASLPHAASVYAQLTVADALEALANAVLRQRQQLLADIGMPATEP